MSKTRRIVCYRYEDEHSQSYYTVYEIPFDPTMTVMHMLDYIGEYLDPTLSHLTHSRCNQGYCARCAIKVNGKSCLACKETTNVETLFIDPLDKKKMSKDLASRP